MGKKPPRRSRYDELHDKYNRILTTKSGTRYERLAATVFKALEDKNAVIHNIELTGDDPEVKHQIDVTVDVAEETRRIVIECKDFDISKDKVGIDVIRNFRSVVEDTKADEGIVITCTGFTEDAQKYARSKGIKLAVLRIFETRDMEGRITKIVVNYIIRQPTNPDATISIPASEQPQYLAQLDAAGIRDAIRSIDPVFFVRDSERYQFNFFVSQRVKETIDPTQQGVVQIVIPPEGWSIQVDNNAPLAFDGIIVKFDIDELRFTTDVVSQRIAELILSGFGWADLVIFGDQIERLTIDPGTGAVRAASA